MELQICYHEGVTGGVHPFLILLLVYDKGIVGKPVALTVVLYYNVTTEYLLLEELCNEEKTNGVSVHAVPDCRVMLCMRKRRYIK